MNKNKFLNLLSQELVCAKTRANKILGVFLKCISISLKNSNKLLFVGFGCFKIKKQKEKRIKTPKGTVVIIPSQKRVTFSVGSELKNIINKSLSK